MSLIGFVSKSRGDTSLICKDWRERFTWKNAEGKVRLISSLKKMFPFQWIQCIQNQFWLSDILEISIWASIGSLPYIKHFMENSIQDFFLLYSNWQHFHAIWCYEFISGPINSDPRTHVYSALAAAGNGEKSPAPIWVSCTDSSNTRTGDLQPFLALGRASADWLEMPTKI